MEPVIIADAARLQSVHSEISELQTRTRLFVIITCGLDFVEGNMCGRALPELLRRLFQWYDLEALPTLDSGVTFEYNNPESNNQLDEHSARFILDLRPILPHVGEFGGRHETLDKITERLWRDYPVKAPKSVELLQTYTEHTCFSVVGCKSGNHRARAIGRKCISNISEDPSTVAVLVHLSTIFPKGSYSSSRENEYEMIVSLVGRALRGYAGTKSACFNDFGKQQSCKYPCINCGACVCCKTGVFHIGHICKKCAHGQCTEDCQAPDCRELCVRGCRDHTWHYCGVHSRTFRCDELCKLCGREGMRRYCVRKKPGHHNHSCSAHEDERHSARLNNTRGA